MKHAQQSPFIRLCLESKGIDHVLSESCYKGTILQRHYRKMTIKWSFSYNSFVNSMIKKFGSHIMIMLYPNLCYSKVCYIGTVL